MGAILCLKTIVDLSIITLNKLVLMDGKMTFIMVRIYKVDKRVAFCTNIIILSMHWPDKQSAIIVNSSHGKMSYQDKI